jgi:hypothetical protein
VQWLGRGAGSRDALGQADVQRTWAYGELGRENCIQYGTLADGVAGTDSIVTLAGFRARLASYRTMTLLPRRAFIALALVALSGVGACSDPAGPTGTVLIRVVNASPFAFDEVVVGFPSQNESYGSLAVGAVTQYRPVTQAYRYANVRVSSGGKTVVQQPIDYVGETPLAPGRYSYVIEMNTLDEPYAAITRLQPE